METVEQILSELEDLYNTIKKTKDNFKKCPKVRLTKGYLEAKLQCVDEYWNSFRIAHKALLMVVTKDKRKQLEYFSNDVYTHCEDTFMQLKADIKDTLSLVTIPIITTGTSSTATHHVPNSQIKLPKIHLPSFSGNYEEWPTFQDLFTSMVHINNTLSNVQKLHYLKSSVTGEADTLLRHIQITEDNYSQAWTILKARYSNKRLIVTSILKRMFNQRKIQNQTSNHIKSLHDTTTECLNSLMNLGVTTDSWDPLIIFLVVQKLDCESHKEWEEHVSKDESEALPKLSTLMKFLETRFRMLELLAPQSTKERGVIRERNLHTSTVEKTCPMCNENHSLCHCRNFGKMEPTQRSEFVKTKFICFNCLNYGHSVKKCRLSTSCRICRRRHHTLLHNSKPNPDAQDPPSHDSQSRVSSHVPVDGEEVETNVNTVMTSYTGKRKIALLATAVVSVRSIDGYTTVLRALIDPGSESCFITAKAAQVLRAKGNPIKGVVLGMGNMKSTINQVVQLEVSSRCEVFNLQIEAYVVRHQLTTQLPKRTIVHHNWPHITGLTLADPNYHLPGSIDLLLGHDEYAQIIQEGIIKGPPGSPCAQNTSLGWILFGKLDAPCTEEPVTVLHNQIEVDEMLKVLWEIDTNTNRTLTKDEEVCEKIYVDTHRRNEDGRYVVNLPFKTSNPMSLEGNTRNIAWKRLQYLERRLNKNPELKKAYTEVIEEYILMGHMEEVPIEETHNKAVYLPHHAVVRSDKETTKTRIVFDASAKGSNGVSLNDELLIGPTLQEDLRSIVMRWRLHKVCFASDIEKMYRMVLVSKDSSDFQRVLWRQNTSKFDEVKDYRLRTVTFGTASAPYLAVRTLIQLADDEGEGYPVATKMIKEDCYVDDLTSGCDTITEAIEVSKQLQTILSKGHFHLKKWVSNNAEFLRSIEPNDRSIKASIDFKMDGTVKALGLSWNLGSDEFHYTYQLPPVSDKLTKRIILADLQKIFDPLGWIAPVVVRAKIFVQKLWLEGIGWDDQVNDVLEVQWLAIRNELNNVNCIKINRWLNTLSTAKKQITLHGFSDASMQAMSAVVYCRVIDENGVIEANIVAARTKVAPIKVVSMPRLELCGAVLLSKLLRHAAQAMRIPSSQVYAWTDSSIVLSWLSGEPNKWKSFVANRVVEILDCVNNSQWHHVASEDNPADVASRGSTISELQANLLWWYGPRFLAKHNIEFKRPNASPTDLEKRRIRVMLNATENQQEERGILDFENYESLGELQRIIAYSRRFLNFKRNSYADTITTKELEDSLNICIKMVQADEYDEEIRRLQTNKPVSNRSPLRSLNPYLDEKTILRVGGRLRHTRYSDDRKHPIIVGNQNSLIRLIIADAHIRTLHGGVQMMLCYLRHKFWILRAKSLVKKHIHNCIICAKQSARTRDQIMGDLPKVRVTPSRPFLNSGVDFAGPFQTLLSKGRGNKTVKTYVAIFICMSTKAIHLELVGDLTAEAFIGAFRRFVARRGKCSQLWSDQGRNFVGANKELHDAWTEANLKFTGPIATTLATEGTQWHFNPPYTPHFGGLWEAGVKSLKHHLKRIVTTHLTYEEMTTILCQVEACLNSRPLCPLDDTDPDNLNPLTPGHFLVGEAPIIVPSPDMRDVRVHALSRWQHTQKMLNDFWRRWQDEFLSRLQQRPKWQRREVEFAIGDIVLIKTDNLPPGKWLLGRIVDKHPGTDGITRVYSVKSGDSITKRTVTKLCALPVRST